jgi:hypothetical protein
VEPVHISLMHLSTESVFHNAIFYGVNNTSALACSPTPYLQLRGKCPSLHVLLFFCLCGLMARVISFTQPSYAPQTKFASFQCLYFGIARIKKFFMPMG